MLSGVHSFGYLVLCGINANAVVVGSSTKL